MTWTDLIAKRSDTIIANFRDATCYVCPSLTVVTRKQEELDRYPVACLHLMAKCINGSGGREQWAKNVVVVVSWSLTSRRHRSVYIETGTEVPGGGGGGGYT